MRYRLEISDIALWRTPEPVKQRGATRTDNISILKTFSCNTYVIIKRKEEICKGEQYWFSALNISYCRSKNRAPFPAI